MENQSGFLVELYKANKYVEEMIQKVWNDLHINHVELLIIKLACSEEPTVTYIANELLITKSAASQAVQKLLDKGLISKYPSKDNKKSFYIKSTSKAKELFKEIIMLYQEKIKEFQEKLGKEEFLMFYSLTSRFNQVMKNIKREDKC